MLQLYNKRMLLTLCFLLCGFVTFSQNIFSGKLETSLGEPVSFANLIIYEKDTIAIIAHTYSNESGFFKFDNIANGEYLLKISCLGYNEKFDLITFPISNKDNKYIIEPNEFILEDVAITGKALGVVWGEDTIKYNPDIFIDGTEKNLGEVLNKLPGIEVDDSGNITAQGKKVEKLLINEKDFFSGNNQMATQNLPPELVDKVEVLNNYTEYSLLEGFTTKEQTVINIKANSSFIGRLSGDIELAGGLYGKYKLTGNLLMLRDKFMVSLIGASNNTGDDVFSIEDYFKFKGGIMEVLSLDDFSNKRSASTELSDIEKRVLLNPNNIFSKTNTLSGVTTSWQPNKKIKINSYMIFNNKQSRAEDFSSYTYLLPDSVFSNTEEKYTTKRSNILDAYLKTTYIPSDKITMKYTGNVSSLASKENTNESMLLGQNSININAHSETRFFNSSHQGNVARKIRKNLLVFNTSFQHELTPFEYNFSSDSIFLPFDFTYKNNNYLGGQYLEVEKQKWKTSLLFNAKLGTKYIFKYNVGYDNKRQKLYSVISDYNDAPEILSDTNNDMFLNISNSYSGVSLTKNKGFLRFKTSVSANMYNLSENTHTDFKDNKIEINPGAELSLHFSETHDFTFSYNVSNNPSDISSFINNPILSDYKTYTHRSVINKALVREKNIGLKYLLYHKYSGTMLYLIGSYSELENTPTINYYFNGLTNQNIPILLSVQSRMFLNTTLDKKLSFISWNARLTGKYVETNNSNMSSDIKNDIKTSMSSVGLLFSSKYSGILNFELGSDILYNENTSSLASQKSSQTTYSYLSKFIVKPTSDLHIQLSANYKANKLNNIKNNFWFLDFDVDYEFAKNIKLGIIGTNVLNLKNQFWTDVYYNGVYNRESHYRQIPGNIMLRLRYTL